MDPARDRHVPRPSAETRGYWGSEKDVGPRGGRGRTQGPHDFTSGPIANEEFRWGGREGRWWGQLCNIQLFPSVMSESGPWSQVDLALSPEVSLDLTSLLCKWRRWH